ncbi:MAG TPA: acyl-CoA dehydrogenase family protein [Actinomycetota bacterium]|nr:acyl-CoA dehydrogenase family protein [Actinomycetota bacterium]
MDPFIQDRPRVSNRFKTDRPLRHAVERLLAPEVFEEVSTLFEAFGQTCVEELVPLQEQAEANPPRHVPFDAWGRRIDRIDVDPAWKRLVQIGQEAGLVSIPYEKTWEESSRVVQFGLLHLFLPVSATAACPLAMTDAAARVLLNEDPDLAAVYVPRLTARSDAWTSGQWMTEKEGGSDVGRTGTHAGTLDNIVWELSGTKWFTSATTADISLALARPEGAEESSRSLSLFLLELRKPDGSWNGITVRRLKDKLGTKALPTAELDLDATIAVPVGGVGRGVAKIASMLNITRVHSAFGANAAAGHGLSLARDYARRREAFGSFLTDLPTHRMWIASIAAEYEAGIALCFRAAELLGRLEVSGEDRELARVVFPLTKMAVARQAVWQCSQLIESFGGAGYVEDTGIPRMLRDAHVNCIWEGTTSVLALDVRRALAKDGVGQAFLEDVNERTLRYDHPLIAESARKVLDAASTLSSLLTGFDESDTRRVAWGMARVYQGALMCEAAGWAIDKNGDSRAATALRVFTARPLIQADWNIDQQDIASFAFDA